MKINITVSAIILVLSLLLAYGIGLRGGWTEAHRGWTIAICVFLTYNSVQVWIWMPRKWRESIRKICGGER